MIQSRNDYDVILLGLGLANTLLALRLRQLKPDLRFCVIERDHVIRGSHTWCFHESDVKNHKWVLPLVSKSWSRYEIGFPKRRRIFNNLYHAIRSEDLFRRASQELGLRIRAGEVVGIHSTQAPTEPGSFRVTLADCSELTAAVVIDGRGGDLSSLETDHFGFQKFVGWEVQLEAPHGLEHPVLTDASVEQVEGFRFFYLLPWDADSLLVEETRYTESPRIFDDEFESGIRAYLDRRGWKIRRILRKERGTLPIPLKPPLIPRSTAPLIGMKGGFFHYVTGYSLPCAARVADHIASLRELNDSTVREGLVYLRARRQSTNRYFSFLNRMLFQAAEPELRYMVLERFYGLSHRLIERFFSGSPTFMDRIRILVGRPPVPVRSAMRCVFPETGKAKTLS